MKLAITGCNGSIGKRVVLAALKAGHTVRGIDRTPHCHSSTRSDPTQEHSSNPSFSFIQVDLRNYDKTREALQGVEAIIQLAAVPNPADYIAETHNTNVVISWNVLRSAAELGINRIAQASSVNVITLVYSLHPKFEYLPLDENHPCLPDEPYGLSKLVCELQAETITRRFPSMRIASLRLSWSIPNPAFANTNNVQDPIRRKNDLWGYTQEDSGAEAFLLAVTAIQQQEGKEGEEPGWFSGGHEAFFIVAPETTQDEDSRVLKERYWADVPVKEGFEFEGRKGFFDCSKARLLLGWVHPASVD